MKRLKILFAASLLCGGCTLPVARAAGLLVADGGLGGVLEIEQHEVDVTINNGIAVTRVHQVFRNTEDRQVEALYTFPVPRGASVANFSMWIAGNEMIGEVVEKERARRIYESYKQVGRDPGLLEQVDYKTFEMRIFPIAARAEQRVEITYYQELDVDADWATWVYPLATDTRGAIDSTTRERFALDLRVRSEVPIVELESPSHGDAFAVARHTPHHFLASLETREGDLGRDVVLAYRTERASTGLDLVASMEPGEDGYFQLTLTAGDELAQSDRGMDYVFVLDVSGSMDNDGKLALSRGSVDAFTRTLGPADRFELITFNVEATALFRELRGSGEDTLSEATEFLRSQRARGGTSLEPALAAAYRYKDPDRPLNVVVLSDGMTQQAERRALLRMIDQRPDGTRVFAIGVGNEVNRPLLDQLATDAGGLAAFVSRGDDFERRAAAFRRKLRHPAIRDLAMEVRGGGRIYDVEPRDLPDLYHGMPVRIYGRYESPGPLVLDLSGNLGGERFEKTLELELPGQEEANPEIERMWAWHRVRRLEDEAGRREDASDLVEEIVRLGEGYSIVTEHTSFLVLENDAEYRRWKIDRRNLLRMDRDRAKHERVAQELAALRAKAADRVGPIERTAKPEPAPDRPAQVARNRPSSRGWDLDLGGGGAFDPLTAGIVVLLAGATWFAGMRKH